MLIHISIVYTPHGSLLYYLSLFNAQLRDVTQ